jgi:hypothetical protein
MNKGTIHLAADDNFVLQMFTQVLKAALVAMLTETQQIHSMLEPDAAIGLLDLYYDFSEEAKPSDPLYRMDYVEASLIKPQRVDEKMVVEEDSLLITIASGDEMRHYVVPVHHFPVSDCYRSVLETMQQSIGAEPPNGWPNEEQLMISLLDGGVALRLSFPKIG